jgi:acyl-CoA synthetase (AMP-forming)/AMP-acid ligase II/acyl carrier protein
MHLVSWHLSAFQMTNRDHASHVARVAFDAAGWEIWSCLAAGACLHIPEDNQVSDPKALQAWLIDKCITISFVPTPIAERLLKLSWPPKTDLRFLLTGGDTLHAHPSPKLPFALINNYGPTECTVVATSGIIHANGSDHSLPPIGRPISGTHIHILDENLRPVPEGVPGEIYIAGMGVARGYRNQPALTEERFIPHPLAGRSGRMFKTGDLAHSTADGQIAFLGRMDEQIKIRGFRIEPNEIVAVLNQHPAITESAVVARDIAGERRLVAHVVLATDARVGPSDLREFIGKQLPDYMVPARFVKLESMPLTPNGKVDRAALPGPDATNDLCDDDSRGTLTEIEEIVAGILQPLLGIEHVNLDANFFSLGGHSLLGIQLISRVREVLGIELPLRTVFDAPSVAELAAEIEQLLCAKLDAMSEEKVQCMLGVAESPET